jgi:valyl-tRNA synthetase
MPPPNITGLPHIGHFYNALLQDLYIRSKASKLLGEGQDLKWIGGIDHAGIGAEYILNQQLKAEGTSKQELGYSKYLERMFQWKGDIEERIKRRIASYKFTNVDSWPSTIGGNVDLFIYRAISSMYEDGLLYKDKRAINHCLQCSTTLSDMEVSYKEKMGKLYIIKYGDEELSLPVATTRPETILADTALAVNPKDERYSSLIGRKIREPISKRELEIIADKEVEMAYGTGILKITPAHSLVDYELARRHSLEIVELFGIDGKVIMPGEFFQLTSEELRAKILARLEVISTEPLKHNVPLCKKCGKLVEILMSEQWFIRIAPLLEETKKRLYHEQVVYRPADTEDKLYAYFDRMHDWCISRQLWWGHKLPISQDMKLLPFDEAADNRELNTLDTWFSSALWQFIASGIDKTGRPRDKILKSQILFTGYDILLFWISRMMLLSPYIVERFQLKSICSLPVSEVALHGLVRDQNGKKLSKTSGNAVAVEELKKKNTLGEIKLALLFDTSVFGRDISVNEKRLLFARNFTTKLDNLLKFLLGQREKYCAEPSRDSVFNHYIVELLSIQERRIKELFSEREYGKALTITADFIWHEFCDWYLEFIKREGVSGNIHVPSISYRLFELLSPFTKECSVYLDRFSKEFSTGELVSSLLPSCNCNCSSLVSRLKSLISNIRIIRSLCEYAEESKFLNIEYEDDSSLSKYAKLIYSMTKTEEIHEVTQNRAYAFTVDRTKLVFPMLDNRKISSVLALRLQKLILLSKRYETKLTNQDFKEHASQAIICETEKKLKNIKEQMGVFSLLSRTNSF